MWEDFKDDLKKDFWETLGYYFVLFPIFGISTVIVAAAFWFFWKPILIVFLFILAFSTIGGLVFVALLNVIDKWENYKEGGDE